MPKKFNIEFFNSMLNLIDNYLKGELLFGRFGLVLIIFCSYKKSKYSVPIIIKHNLWKMKKKELLLF